MSFCFFFFFNDTATTEIYTLSLHDALPISRGGDGAAAQRPRGVSRAVGREHRDARAGDARSEEHTSELQSRLHLVCRLLLEKKKKRPRPIYARSSSSSTCPQQSALGTLSCS